MCGCRLRRLLLPALERSYWLGANALIAFFPFLVSFFRVFDVFNLKHLPFQLPDHRIFIRVFTAPTPHREATLQPIDIDTARALTENHPPHHARRFWSLSIA